jgi:hypothetical protein
MLIRVGIPSPSGPFLGACLDRETPVLVSANSLWNDATGEFRDAGAYGDLDWALDSGGFVAMARYGRYRWPMEEYVAFAWQHQPTWYSQMDFCCEPEIAGNSAAVQERVWNTVDSLIAMRQCVRRMNSALGGAVPAADPVPVLQGWKPQDYVQCVNLMSAGALDEWPALVGVGSVCRRQMSGPDGLMAVLDAIDAALPKHVRLHLFGVKGQALRELGGWDRIASVDSMAWSYNARRVAFDAKVGKTRALEVQEMARWLGKATGFVGEGAAQLRLQFA